MREVSWLMTPWNNLVASYRQQRLPHAILISGPEGLGKKDFAHKFSQLLFCSERDKRDYACGKCKSCHLFSIGHLADYKLIEPLEGARSIKVDQVRELNQFIQQTAQNCEYKVIVLNLAEQMNRAASNALLKSLEEPQGNTLFILLTESPGALLPTLISRCQVLALSVPQYEDAERWLAQSVNDRGRIALALWLALGAPLKAEAILKDNQDVAFKQFANDIFAFFQQKKSVVDVSEVWHKQGLEFICYHLQLLLAYLLKLCSQVQQKNDPFNLPESFCQKIFSRYDYQHFYRMQQAVLKIERALREKVALNPQLSLEEVLLA